MSLPLPGVPDDAPFVPSVPAGDEPAPASVPAVPETLAQLAPPVLPHRVHLVVVRTRPADPPDPAAPALVARWWHPIEARWTAQPVESAEHAVRLLTDEQGWTLRQQQALDAPGRHELIFEAPLHAVRQPTVAEVLEEEVGLAPGDVAEMLQRVDERVDADGGTPP